MVRPYVFLNILLAAAAIAATGWMMTRGQPAYRIVAEHQPEHDTQGVADALPAVRHRPMANTAPPNIEVLWEDVLFHPDRREGVEIVGDPETVDDRPSPTNMQLMAIGVINQEAAAVIVLNEPRRGRGQTTTRRTQHVYKLGAEIDQTGYTIKEITLNEVLLVKGEEERVLRLFSDDEASRNRRTAAVQARAVQAAASETEASAGAPPPPPPPPPVPVMPGRRGREAARDQQPSERRDGDDDLTREERIRLALERRRELIERLRRARGEEPTQDREE